MGRAHETEIITRPNQAALINQTGPGIPGLELLSRHQSVRVTSPVIYTPEEGRFPALDRLPGQQLPSPLLDLNTRS